MKSSKWGIINDFLSVLFFPFVAFDIFLFYDDGTGDFEMVGKLWLITFLICFIFYLCKHKVITERTLLREMFKLVFSSFIILFFILNFFLAGLFLMIVRTSGQFII